MVGRCERLPIASATIDLVICNHALEHIIELNPAIEEIGRVLKPTGRLYVSVPDGYSVSDGIYRWLFEGGGHVNRFRRDDLIRLIESRIGVRLAQSQRLYSSFGYLQGIPDLLADARPDLQARLKRIARLPRFLIHAAHTGLYAGTRVIDRWFGTSTAIYGWALWFDRAGRPATENPPFVNVCMYCGSGHPGDSSERPFYRSWACASCGRRKQVLVCLSRRPAYTPLLKLYAPDSTSNTALPPSLRTNFTPFTSDGLLARFRHRRRILRRHPHRGRRVRRHRDVQRELPLVALPGTVQRSVHRLVRRR